MANLFSTLTEHQKVQRLKKSFALKPQYQATVPTTHGFHARWYCESQSVKGKGYFVRVSFVRDRIPNHGLSSTLDVYCQCFDFQKHRTCKHSLAVTREYDGDYTHFFRLFNVTNYKDLNKAMDAQLAEISRGVAA